MITDIDDLKKYGIDAEIWSLKHPSGKINVTLRCKKDDKQLTFVIYDIKKLIHYPNGQLKGFEDKQDSKWYGLNYMPEIKCTRVSPPWQE